jgi:hypothetical protein
MGIRNTNLSNGYVTAADPCLPGLTIIRAYGAQARFLNEFHDKQNDHSRMWFLFLTTGRWLGFRLDALCGTDNKYFVDRFPLSL